MKKLLYVLFLLVGFKSVGQIYKFELYDNILIVRDTTNDVNVIIKQASDIYYEEVVAGTSIRLLSNNGSVGRRIFVVDSLIDDNGDAFGSYAAFKSYAGRILGGNSYGVMIQDTLSADGSTTEKYIRGYYTVHSFGTWGSGSLDIEYSSDNSHWETLYTFSTDTVGNVEQAGYIRGTLSGSSSPTIYINIDKIK